MSFITKAERKLVPSLDGRGVTAEAGVVWADDTRCTGCNLCIEICPGSALEMSGKKQVRMISADLVPCMACGDCVAICQPAALRLSAPQRYGGFFRFLHRGRLTFPRRF